MADLILDVDYNITSAEAKQQKLQREYDITKKEIENKKIKLDLDSQNIEKTKEKLKILKDELEEIRASNLQKTLSGTITTSDLNAYKAKKAEIEKITQNLDKQLKSYQKEESSLEKLKAKIVDIGNKIVINEKKQNKFSKAFEKSGKSADRFSKRLKSLISSALFFTLVTKAFTALRNEFGKMITEANTKTARLVAQLNNNLAVLGRTLYEGIRPQIEWLLEKLLHITQLITIAMAKALGKDVEEMKSMVKASKELAKNSEKTTANFDTLQKIDSNSTDNSSTSSDVYLGATESELKETEMWLRKIAPLVTIIGGAFGAWKITGLLSQMEILKDSTTNFYILLVASVALIAYGSITWQEGLHNGENTLQSIFTTIGYIGAAIALIAIGITAWPVLIVAALAILGIWYDNFKDKVDKWIESLPVGISEFVNQVKIAAYAVWDLLKNLFKGIYEIFTGDWEKGLKRIGIALVNLLVDALNLLINATNGWLTPIRALISGIGKIAGKNWNIKNISIPTIPRIPQLATGAVLPGGSPMLAWVNDQPKGQTYVEGSVENIAAAFEKYLGGKSFGNQNITLEAKGNWAQFIKWMNLQIKQEDDRATIWR